MIAKVSTGKGIGEPCHARVLMIDAWKGCLISSVSTFETRETYPSWHEFNASCDPRTLLPSPLHSDGAGRQIRRGSLARTKLDEQSSCDGGCTAVEFHLHTGGDEGERSVRTLFMPSTYLE